MKNTLKKLLCAALAALLVLGLAACGGSSAPSTRVVIYSAQEDYRNDHLLARLKEQFPSYDIVLEYIPTGNLAAKLKAEGADTESHIVVGLDSSLMPSLRGLLADLSSHDYSAYLPELVPEVKDNMVWERWSGCIAYNPTLLAEKGLPVPTGYDDLLNPAYKGLISMPNPKSSGTGYFFLHSLINTRGEDAAFDYFDALAPNVLQFTSSGSGPINALVQGEAAIGLAMTFQAVTERNNGADITILHPAEGAPYSTSSCAIIEGKQDNEAVQAVFAFIMGTLVHEDKELFSPEKIFTGQTITVENYPDITYADMSGTGDAAEKERLLEKWAY